MPSPAVEVAPSSIPSAANAPPALDPPNPFAGPPALPLDPRSKDAVKAAMDVAARAKERTIQAALVTEEQERGLVFRNKPAKLVDLGGNPERGTTLTMHGINGSPTTVQALSDSALQRGEHTLTVAYDDNYRRLTRTTADLMGLISTTLKEMPKGTTLTLRAHCMATRPMVVALDRLAREGKLDPDARINLDLIGPPLQGFPLANFALPPPEWLSGYMLNVLPGKDMAPAGEFQQELDRASLPANVKIRVIQGDKDHLIDVHDPEFRDRVQALGATLVVVRGGDHASVLDFAASHPP